MKKSFGLLVLASALLFSGCFSDLAIPEKVSLKTEAEYSFTVASFDSTKDEKLDMSGLFDLEKLLEGAGTGNSATGFQVYKYNNGISKNQQYLINMPLSDIDLDLGETFQNMDFAKTMEGMSIEQKFSVPNVTNINETSNVPLDAVNDAINKALIIGGVFYGSPVSVDATGFFSALEFDSGKINVTAGDPVAGEGLLPDVAKKNINGVIILKADGEEVTRANLSNGSAELPLAGKTLKGNISIEFENMDNDYFTFKGLIDSSSKVKKASGLTIPTDVTLKSNITIPFSVDAISECVINNGSAVVSINIPSEWIGVSVTDYELKTEGGFEVTLTENGVPVRLEDKELKSEDIKIISDITIKFQDSTIDFENPPSVTAAVSIEEFTATINLGDDYNNSIDVETPIPADISTFVKEINWNKIGFKITGKNTLPAGNNISISNFSSSFLGLGPDSVSITAGGDPVEKEIVAEHTTTDFTGSDIKIDVKGNILLPGGVDKKITVRNVVPGNEYEIAVKVEPILDWESVAINASNANFQGDMNTGLNLSEMFKQLNDMVGIDIGSKINIATLPIYLYGSFPELSAGYVPRFEGIIKTFYADDDGTPTSDPEYLLGSTGDIKADFSLKPIPEFTRNDKNEVINNFGDPTADLKSLMNNKTATGKLNVHYDIGLTSETGEPVITVDKSSLQALQEAGSSKISMGIMMVLSVDFELTDAIELDLSSFMQDDDSADPLAPPPTEQERDLLGRDSADAYKDMQKYIDLIESVNFVVSDISLPIETGDLKFVVDSNGETIVNAVIKQGEKFEVSLDPSTVIDTYPFEPTMKFVINAGNFGLPREMRTAGKLKLKVKTKGKVDLWEKDNGGEN